MEDEEFGHPQAAEIASLPRRRAGGATVGDRVNVRSIALAAIVGAGVLLALREAAPVLVPVLVSVLLAYALEPLVSTLTRWRLPRPAAAVVVYVVLVAAIVLGARELRDEAASLVDELPVAMSAIREALTQDAGRPANPIARVREALAGTRPLRPAAASSTGEAGVARVTIVGRPFEVRRYFLTIGRAALEAGVQTLAVAILTFLLLATGDRHRRKLLALVAPALRDSDVAFDLMATIDRQIQRYLLVRLLICGIVAAATGFALWCLGVDNAAALGLVAGALNVVPFFGPTIGVVAAALAALLQFKTLAMAGAAGGAALVVAAIEGNLITPLLMSRAGELNTVAVFVSVLAWGWVWDVWGLLLAVPIMVAVKAAAEHIEPLKPIGELLGP